MGNNDADINIRIKSTADNAGIDSSKKGIQGLLADFKAAPGVLGKFKVAMAAAVGATAALAVAVGGLKKAVAEYGQAQEGIFKLDAALRQQGNLVEEVRQKYQGLAGALQESTAIPDDKWIEVMTRLTQFGVEPEQMEKMVMFTKNLAGVMGGDVTQAAEAVIKALGGNFRAFQMLGIVIPESTSNFDKLNAAMKAAARIGAGQLEAAASGVNGQVKQMNNSIGDAYEAVGALVAASRILETPIKAITWAAKLFNGTLDDTVPKVNGMVNLFQRSKLSATEAAKATNDYTKALKDFEKQADKTTKTLNAELEAAEAVKEILDAEAAQQTERDIAVIRSWEKNGAVKPEQAEALIKQRENRADEEQHARDQDFRRAKAQNLQKQENNENNAIFKAEQALRDVQRIAKDETKIQEAFDQAVAPFKAEIDDLLAQKEEWSKDPRTISLDVVRQIDAAIEAKQMEMAGAAQEFNKGNPRVNPLALQVEAAKENLRKVKEERGGNIYELQGQRGRVNLEMDSADRVQKIERHTEAIERGGPAMVGKGVEAQIFSQAQKDAYSLFQQFAKENAETARQQAEAYRQAIQEIKAVRTEVQQLKNWHQNERTK